MEVDPTLDEYSHWLTLVDCLKVTGNVQFVCCCIVPLVLDFVASVLQGEGVESISVVDTH
jgi:hypothetical protein